MDTILEDIADIPSLTVNNLKDISFSEMLKILTPFVLVQVPETDLDLTSVKKRYDFLLARLSNLYAFLQLLGVHASYERARLKAAESSKADDMLKKKEALFELAAAVKLKYEAVSRKITLALNEDEDDKTPDRVNYDTRRDTAAGRPYQSPASQAASSKPSDTGTAAPPSRGGGGWGNVG